MSEHEAAAANFARHLGTLAAALAVKEAALSAAADAALALGDEGDTGEFAPCPTGAAADHHRHDCPCHAVELRVL